MPINLQVEIEGLTGDIRFSEEGRRQNYSLEIVEMTVSSGIVKVAEWSDRHGFTMENKYNDILQSHGDYEKNRTYVFTTMLEEPYLMQRKGKNAISFDSNDAYEGYCKDLADLIARKLGINCKTNIN